MSKKCPYCEKDIDHLQVSQQIEGCQRLSDLDKQEPLHPIEWKLPEEQKEEVIYTCPLCHMEIEDDTLNEWGLI